LRDDDEDAGRACVSAGCAYSLLVVHTVAAAGTRSASDLTARARIRDAAIEVFAREGFEAPFRSIATVAGVSPALITHHFGAKAALRAECDAEVLRRYHALKSEAVAGPSAYLFDKLAIPGPAANVLVYMLRAIHSGGRPAEQFLARLIDHVREFMAEGAAAGLIRPSRDEEARNRHLTYQTMGAMLIEFLVAPQSTPDEFVASLVTSQRDAVLPILELYTEGLLADRTLLDDYLAFTATTEHPER
jgi:AcrR family transcriptional regulator